MKRIFFIVLVALCNQQLSARVVVPGSPINPNTTLPVGINFFPVLNALADGAFISAQSVGAQEFAIAGYKSDSQKFVPYAEQTVSLNDETGTLNPLYNAQIDLMSFPMSKTLISGFFAVPNKNNPSLFYRPGLGTLFSTDAILDANGNPASTVVAMVGTTGGTYLAVTPQGSTNFGDPGSGVILVVYSNNRLNVLTTTSLNASNAAFTLGTDPVTMMHGASLGWSIPLGMGYLAGAQITSGAAATDRISLVTRGVNTAFTPILSPNFDLSSLVPGTNYGLLATGASVTGVIPFIQLMQTSTNQEILVTCGRILNIGEIPSDVHNQVYAYPLSFVTDTSDPLNAVVIASSGLLAKKGTVNPALTAADLYTIDDAVVKVGQGPLPTNAVLNQLLVNGDCVYAVVNAAVPGIYMSRVLFDNNGLAIGWTPWMRIINTPNVILASSLFTIAGTWLMLTTSNAVANTVMRTAWQTPDSFTGVAKSLTQLTGPVPQSITALNGYDYRTPGMGNVSAWVCVERNQVILAQTGSTISSNPTLYQQLLDSNYGTPVIAEDTMLTSIVGSNPLVQITGGIFNTMKPLTTATIVHSDIVAQTWLVVGGANGIAIWATPSGNGWGNAFGSDLNALPVGLVMQPLGNYTDVRTVYADSPFLYVATSSQVDRIDLTNGIANPPVVTIAKTGVNLMSGDVITDILFCKELGLISTTGALHRIAPGSSALAAQPLWVVQELPESEFPIEKITGYGLNGLSNSLNQGGDCWILSGTARNNRSILNRLAVSPFSGSLTNNTVKPFATDWFISPQKPSFFLDFGLYQDSVVSDGAQYLFGRSVEFLTETLLRSPDVRDYFKQPRSQNRFVGIQSPFVIPLGKVDINALVQEPATGAWYIATNTGLVVQG